MSQRLQVVVADAELRRFRKAALSRGLTVAEWVRQALRRAADETTSTDPGRKLAALRAATAHSFPAGTIEEMLAEIEHGYEVRD